MVKILARGGQSLADTYDVKGSSVAIEQLEAGEVSLVHEMGATIFSERLSGFVRRVSTGNLTQNTAFDSIMTNLPATPWRVLGVAVISDSLVRQDNCQISIQDPLAGREMPIFSWASANDVASNIRIQEGGGAAAAAAILIPTHPLLVPNLGMGSHQPQGVNDITFRGLTTGFGAGTVALVAIVYIAFSQVGGLSSRGLPVPGW